MWSIGGYAFGWCHNLRSVVIPAGVYSISSEAFNNDSSLESIAISDSVAHIDAGAFNFCKNLTNITVDENNTTYLGAENCIIERASKTLVVGSKSGTIPTDGSVTSIGSSAFYSRGLTSIAIPDSVTSIGSHAFYYCTGLTSVTIGSGVTSIAQSAFGQCEALNSITLACVNPPEIQQWTFSQIPYNCPIYVPAEGVEAYKEAQYWSERASYIFAKEE